MNSQLSRRYAKAKVTTTPAGKAILGRDFLPSGTDIFLNDDQCVQYILTCSGFRNDP